MAIILRKFLLENISDSSLIFIVGSPQSGKSTITKELLYKKKYPIGLVISHKPIQKINKTYDYIPPIFIHSKYDEYIIKKYIKTQKSNILAFNQTNDFDSRSFIILEDIFYEDDLLRNKYIRCLLKTYNEMNILCIIEMEYLRGFTKYMQENIDYIFILRDNIQINRQKIYELCKDKLGIEFTLFNKFMDDYTEDLNTYSNNFTFLILDVKSQSNNIQDKLFWYKASVYKNLRLCSNEAWIYNNTNYVVENPKDHEMYLQKIYQRQIFN